MKIPAAAYVLTVSTVTVSSILFSPSSALSQQPTFECGTNPDGLPATIVKSPKHGDIPIITWNSGFFKEVLPL